MSNDSVVIDSEDIPRGQTWSLTHRHEKIDQAP